MAGVFMSLKAIRLHELDRSIRTSLPEPPFALIGGQGEGEGLNWINRRLA